MVLRLGTRGSPLALFQANLVASLLQRDAGVTCHLVVIRTSGDRLSEAALSEIGGKRLFVKEIEDALLGAEIDLAVHSSKDMPAVLPPGLGIGAALPREDARDAIVLPAGADSARTVADVATRLGPRPRIGTSSVRRVAQLTALFPSAVFLPIRGNLDTRMRKLDAGDYDAIVLASAGLVRLDHRHRIAVHIPVEACVPAPGQGIIAIEIRSADTTVGGLVQTIDHAPSRAALEAERALVRRLGGGCQMPIGAYAHIIEDMLQIRTIVTSLDGSRTMQATASGPAGDAARVGDEAADRLLAQGAAGLLADVAQAQRASERREP